MKKDIHPVYKKKTTPKCMCGAEYEVNSTNDNRPTLEICSNCHPAYNDGVKVEKAARGRLQAYQERMAKISIAKGK